MFENLSVFRLKVLCEVAETKSFHIAAENLQISQPSVSQHISALEKETQCILFVRGRTNTLTEEGKYLYQYAREIITKTLVTAQTLQEMNNGNIGRVKFGATSSLVDYMIPSLCKNFIKNNPQADIDFALSTGLPHIICELVLSREVCFGIVVGNVTHPELDTEIISKDKIAIVVAPDHPFARKECLTPQEISTQSFIYSEEAPSYLRSVRSVLLDNGISICKTGIEIDSMSGIKQVLKNGFGISAIIYQYVAEEIKAGTLCELNLADGPLFVDICLVSRKDRFLSALSKNFISFIIETQRSPMD